MREADGSAAQTSLLSPDVVDSCPNVSIFHVWDVLSRPRRRLEEIVFLFQQVFALGLEDDFPFSDAERLTSRSLGVSSRSGLRRAEAPRNVSNAAVNKTLFAGVI